MDSVAEAAGVSRATLFNYFPQKELILREIAAARVAKLKAILEEFAASGKKARYDDVAELIVRLTVENARISRRSRRSCFWRRFSGRRRRACCWWRGRRRWRRWRRRWGILCGGRRRARRVAETVFAVYIATMLEWLMREGVPQKWLMETMRERLLVLREGVA